MHVLTCTHTYTHTFSFSLFFLFWISQGCALLCIPLRGGYALPQAMRIIVVRGPPWSWNCSEALGNRPGQKGHIKKDRMRKNDTHTHSERYTHSEWHTYSWLFTQTSLSRPHSDTHTHSQNPTERKGSTIQQPSNHLHPLPFLKHKHLCVKGYYMWMKPYNGAIFNKTADFIYM